MPVKKYLINGFLGTNQKFHIRFHLKLFHCIKSSQMSPLPLTPSLPLSPWGEFQWSPTNYSGYQESVCICVRIPAAKFSFQIAHGALMESRAAGTHTLIYSQTHMHTNTHTRAQSHAHTHLLINWVAKSVWVRQRDSVWGHTYRHSVCSHWLLGFLWFKPEGDAVNWSAQTDTWRENIRGQHY